MLPFTASRTASTSPDLPLEKLAHLPGLVVRVDPAAGRAVTRDVLRRARRSRQGRARPDRLGPALADRPVLRGPPVPDRRRGATYLAEAGAALVGIDSLNIDDTADLARPVHTALLGAGIPIVEHLTGLAHLPG